MASTNPIVPVVNGVNSNPSANALAAFIDGAHVNDFGNIDPNIVTTIGQSMGNNPGAATVLSTIKAGLAVPNKTSQYLFETSANNPPQTTAKVVQDHLANTGIAPVAPPTIVSMQKQLQKDGFGLQLTPSGAWNTDWANAAYQHTLAVQNQPGIATVGSRGLFSSIFDSGFLSHAIPLVMSVLKSIPGDSLKGLGDGLKLTADAVGAFQDFVGNESSASWSKSEAYHIANWASNLGQALEGQANLTDQQYAHQSNWQAAVAIGNTALALSTIGKLGEGTALGVKTAVTAGKEAGAKSAASALVTDVGAQAPQGVSKWIMNTVLPATQDGNRFLGTRWLRNVPAAQPLVNGLDKIATNGMTAYKTAAKVAATPYRLPVVGALGNAITKTSFAGMKLGLQGKEQTYLGDPNGTEATALTHLKPITGVVGEGLNLLQIAGHPAAYGSEGAPTVIGNAINTATQALSKGLNRNGIASEWERGTGNSIKELTQKLDAQGLPPEALSAIIYDAHNRAAASDSAQALLKSAVDKGAIDGNNADQVTRFLQNAQHVILNDPEKLAQARESYLLKPMAFAKDMNKNKLTFKEDPTSIHSNDIPTYAKATEVYRKYILPHIGTLVTPDSIANNAIAVRRAAGEKIEPWEVPHLSAREAQNATLNDDPIGSKFGLAKLAIPSARDAQNTAMDFFNELQEAKPGFQAPKTLDGLENGLNAQSPAYEFPKTFDRATATGKEIALRSKVLKYLGEQLGRNVRDFTYVPTEDLINLIVEKSHLLFADAHLPVDANPALAEGVRRLAALGYKPAYGTDIGHIFTNPTIPLDALGQEHNTLSRIGDKLGLNFAEVHPEVAAQNKYIQAQHTVTDAVAKIQATNPEALPAWATGTRVLGYLQDVLRPETSGMARAYVGVVGSKLGKALTLRGLKGGVWEKEIESLIGTTIKKFDGSTATIANRDEALTHIKNTLAAESNPSTWTRKEVVNALMAKGDERGTVTNVKGFEQDAFNVSGQMTPKIANDIYYALQKGLRSEPTYTGGINPLSRLLNSSLGLSNIPLNINGRRVLDLTGDIQPMLIKNRYSYSPRQAWLRVVKSGIKGVNENMPLSLNPKAALADLGPKVEKAAYDLRDSVLGKNPARDEAIDYISKEFASRDLANIYDPRAIEARTLHYVSQNMAEEGKDINTVAGKAELLKRFDAINNYGNQTAAEKTVNGFFFPFSFEKTVARELGAHMLNSPSTRLMVATAIAAYNSADGQKMKTWMEQNIPLFSELEKFNPYYHGAGLGTFGGINRTPYSIVENMLYGNKATAPVSLNGVSDADKLALFVHMLQPKPMTGTASVKAALSLVPAMQDLSKIIVGYDPSGKAPFNPGGEVRTSLQTLAWEAGSEMQKLAHGQITGHGNTENWQIQGHLPYAVQQTNAWDLRAKLMAQAASALAANRAGGSVPWPDSVPAVAGEKVSSTTINTLVNYIYPQWDPNQGIKSVAARNTATGLERTDVLKKAPSVVPLYDQFIKYSNQVQAVINKDSINPAFDPSALAGAMEYLRQTAAKLAASDDTFPAFYAKYFASKYGPLKGL